MSDLISREEVLNLIDTAFENGAFDGRYAYENLVDAVQNLIHPLETKALEKEPCEDCISRKAATDRFDLVQSDDKCIGYDDVMKFLLSLPSVKPERKPGKWIPVSERLPKTAGVYRVTRYFPNNVMNPNYLVDACFFDGYNTWYNDNRINHERAYVDNIIAWQDNPEPYKAESEEI